MFLFYFEFYLEFFNWFLEYIITLNSYNCVKENLASVISEVGDINEDTIKDGNIMIIHSSPYSCEYTIFWYSVTWFRKNVWRIT